MSETTGKFCVNCCYSIGEHAGTGPTNPTLPDQFHCAHEQCKISDEVSLVTGMVPISSFLKCEYAREHGPCGPEGKLFVDIVENYNKAQEILKEADKIIVQNDKKSGWWAWLKETWKCATKASARPRENGLPPRAPFPPPPPPPPPCPPTNPPNMGSGGSKGRPPHQIGLI